MNRPYDKKLDAKASELRADGCAVQADIADDDWIPRAAFGRPPLAMKGEPRPLQEEFVPAPPFEWVTGGEK